MLIISAIFLILTSLLVARKYSKSKADFFWIFLGTFYLQISFISLLLSLFHFLNPHSFLTVQILVFSACFIILKSDWVDFIPEFNFKTFSNRNIFTLSLFMMIAVIIVLCLFQRILTPIFDGDVRYYHASRVLYWIQNSSIGYYSTMNDRQLVFSFGSELIFLWGVLFTHSEFIARLIFWLAFPLSAIGLFTSMRTLRCSTNICLLGVAVFLSMPIVFRYSITLKPLIWVTLFTLGAGYWSLRLYETSAKKPMVIFWFAIFCVLSPNVKISNIFLVPAGLLAVLILIFLTKKSNSKLSSIWNASKMYAFSALVALIISGLGFLMVKNVVHFGHPLGSKLRRSQNIAEFSPYQIYVHTVRFCAFLSEIPVPVGMRKVEKFGNQLIGWLNADKPLPKEVGGKGETWKWVGRYRYYVPSSVGNSNFGFAGLFCLLTLIGFLKNIKNSRILACSIIMFSLLITVLYLLRWFTGGLGTRRFLTPVIAGLLPLSFSLWNDKHQGRKIFSLVSLLFVAFILGFIFTEGKRTLSLLNKTKMKWSIISHTQIKGPQMLRLVPEDAVLLILVHPNFKDYVLFGKNYSRKVIQLTEKINENNLKYLLKKYPGAYIYIDKRRYSKFMLRKYAILPNIKSISRNTISVLWKSSNVEELAVSKGEELFRFKSKETKSCQ